MKKIEEYVSEAQMRAKRRKSPWNLLLAIVTIIMIVLVWFYSCKLILYLTHNGYVPSKAILDRYDIQMIFITIPLFFSSMVWGMILGNSLMWLIPPARMAFERESQGHKGCSYRKTMSALMKLAIILSVITIPIAVFASYQIKL